MERMDEPGINWADVKKKVGRTVMRGDDWEGK